MRSAIALMVVVCGPLLVQAASAAEMTELPAGPDRELVSKTCQSCHDLQMVFDAAGVSREVWDAALDEMTANGMVVSAEDRAKILNYLSTYLGPSPPQTAGQ
ncbi:MAG TPA: hypothetical protein VKW08_24985 [Xanthobacteraceae bacterium]|jgi:cytochrome c5|nr:hypothetical protein [Xanthobacteraceae bacterium]